MPKLSVLDPGILFYRFLPLLLMMMVAGKGYSAPPSEGAVVGPPVALLDFTARHVDPEQVKRFSRNLREAFMIDGRFDMLDEMAMFETLDGPDGDEKLKEARRLLADAKKEYRAGRYEETSAKVEQARALHRTLNSELSRTDELADLMLYEGLVLFQQGRAEAARITFIQMFLLDSTIEVHRLPSVPPEALTLLDQAREQVQAMPLRGLSPSFAMEVAGRLQVSHLITGIVDTSKSSSQPRATVTIQIMSPAKAEPETTLMFELDDISSGFPPAGAPVYEKIVGLTARFLTAP